MISRSLDVVEHNGEVLPLTVTVSEPKYDPQYMAYACAINFDNWIESPQSTIKGEDSYQSMTLAMQLIHSILLSYYMKGIRYRWRDLEDEFDLDCFLVHAYPSVVDVNSSPQQKQG